MLISTFVLGSLAFGIGYTLGLRATASELADAERELAEYRLAADARYAELARSLDGARERSERAGRGLEEAARTAGTIADRSKRIVYLIGSIREAVTELTGGTDGGARAVTESTILNH